MCTNLNLSLEIHLYCGEDSFSRQPAQAQSNDLNSRSNELADLRTGA
jgi:hypothetical protein